ncbi:hypothetical protein PsorP6_002502 [Peronosclerospora sorghi]|uniref:Uncharacterized protein n=1 Tax=Peronosclerospora sorghi TaxID=230839 RepID=A0ACC0WRD7_9STRA|nr:hypothetical protein PsorP6_002502 [Peronosclerospora sorghi]
MKCSFHNYGEFFHSTGDLKDIGFGEGKHYAVNFSCRDGMDDESFTDIFRSVIAKVMEHSAPGAVLLQCVGGGGYTLRNVARAWCYEASLLVGVDTPDAMPYHDYFEYYGPEYRLHLPVSNMENLNTPAYLDNIKRSIHENLCQIEAVPSVPFTVAPPLVCSEKEEKTEASRDREEEDTHMMDVSGERQLHN